MLKNPRSVVGQEDIVLRSEFVGKRTGSRYAKRAACPKLPKGIGRSTGKILRCCRDLFRPCAKNSSNAKGLCLSTIVRVLRATFWRSSSWHRFMVGSSRDLRRVMVKLGKSTWERHQRNSTSLPTRVRRLISSMSSERRTRPCAVGSAFSPPPRIWRLGFAIWITFSAAR